MYFDKHVVRIEDLIKAPEQYFAHKPKGGNRPKETLKEHTNLAEAYFLRIFEEKGLEQCMKVFERKYFDLLSREAENIFRKMMFGIVTFHDFGKVNPYFQKEKMDHEMPEARYLFSNNAHSLISAVLYFEYFMGEIWDLEKTDKKQLKEFLFLNTYLIAKHHSDLGSFETFLKSFEEHDQTYRLIEILETEESLDFYKKKYQCRMKREKIHRAAENIKKTARDKKDQSRQILFYSYERLLYSLLVASDYYATSEYMNQIKMNRFGGMENTVEFRKIYEETDLYRKIRHYEEETYRKEKDLLGEENINVLRTELFLDAERELKQHKDKKVFFLEAPTGKGILETI